MDICVYHLGLFVFFPGVFFSSRVTGACPVTTDLIVRVNVRTTTITTATTVYLLTSGIGADSPSNAAGFLLLAVGALPL